MKETQLAKKQYRKKQKAIYLLKQLHENAGEKIPSELFDKCTVQQIKNYIALKKSNLHSRSNTQEYSPKYSNIEPKPKNHQVKIKNILPENFGWYVRKNGPVFMALAKEYLEKKGFVFYDIGQTMKYRNHVLKTGQLDKLDKNSSIFVFLNVEHKNFPPVKEGENNMADLFYYAGERKTYRTSASRVVRNKNFDNNNKAVADWVEKEKKIKEEQERIEQERIEEEKKEEERLKKMLEDITSGKFKEDKIQNQKRRQAKKEKNYELFLDKLLSGRK